MIKKGFTLLEIVISIALLAVIFGFSVAAINEAKKLLFASEQIEVVQLLNEASIRARTGINGSNWGVAIFSDPTTSTISSAILFSGDDFATRDTDYDLEFSGGQVTLLNQISLTNRGVYTGAGNEIIFEVYTGDPHQKGFLILETEGRLMHIDIHSWGIPIIER